MWSEIKRYWLISVVFRWNLFIPFHIAAAAALFCFVSQSYKNWTINILLPSSYAKNEPEKDDNKYGECILRETALADKDVGGRRQMKAMMFNEGWEGTLDVNNLVTHTSLSIVHSPRPIFYLSTYVLRGTKEKENNAKLFSFTQCLRLSSRSCSIQ